MLRLLATVPLLLFATACQPRGGAEGGRTPARSISEADPDVAPVAAEAAGPQIGDVYEDPASPDRDRLKVGFRGDCTTGLVYLEGYGFREHQLVDGLGYGDFARADSSGADCVATVSVLGVRSRVGRLETPEAFAARRFVKVN